MRFELVEPEEIQIRESQGYVKDIYDPAVSVRQPLSEYRTMLDLIHRDPTLAAAFDIIVDFATYRGYDFTGATEKVRNDLREKFNNDLNFRQILPNLIYTMLYYGDAYIELRRNNSVTPNELHILETTEMRIIYDIHGKVSGYVQRQFDMSGLSEEEILRKEKTIVPKSEGGNGEDTYGMFWEEEEVIHFRMKWIGSQVYSYNPNEPISQAGATKLYAGNYLMNIFINMPPRYVAHLAGISEKDYNGAKNEFRSAKTNYKRTIAFSRSSDPNSKLQFQEIKPPFSKELIEIIKWLDLQLLKVTRVPRSWIEESGIENRGVTESEQRPFDVRIQAIHRNSLEPDLNRKLLPWFAPERKPKGAERKAVFRFNEISRKGEKEILQNTELLVNMGLKPVAMVRYLDERGILGLDPADFNELQLNPGIPGGRSDNGAMPGKKSKDLMPSRQRKKDTANDMTSNLNEAGVSDDSARKMPATA